MTDPAHVLGDVDVGDKVDVTRKSQENWNEPFVVVEADKPTEWRVPFGENWIDRELVFAYKSPSGTKYEVEARADGFVGLYRTYEKHGRKLLGSASAVDVVGAVEQHTKLRLIGQNEEDDEPRINGWDDVLKEGAS